MFYCKIIWFINLVLSTGVGKIDWPPEADVLSTIPLSGWVGIFLSSLDHSALPLLQITAVSHCHKQYHLYERKVSSTPPILDLGGLFNLNSQPSENCILAFFCKFWPFNTTHPHHLPPQNFQWHSMAWVRIFSGTTQWWLTMLCMTVFFSFSTFKDQFCIPGFILHKATTVVNVSCFMDTRHLCGIPFLYCQLKSVKLLIMEGLTNHYEWP